MAVQVPRVRRNFTGRVPQTGNITSRGGGDGDGDGGSGGGGESRDAFPRAGTANPETGGGFTRLNYVSVGELGGADPVGQNKLRS